MLANAVRAHIAEFGVLDRQGIAGTAALMRSSRTHRMTCFRNWPGLLSTYLSNSFDLLQEGIKAHILAWHPRNEASRRLATTPGIGPIIASAIAATAVGPNRL